MKPMPFTQLTATMLRHDARLIGRDSLLLTMLALIILLAIGLRYLLPWADETLAANGVLPNASLSMRLSDMYPMVISFSTLFQGSVIAGTIFGFLLIEEKEDQTIKAMMVTPISMNRYLAYRLSIPALIAFLTVPTQIWIINLGQPSLIPMIAISLSAAMLAPIIALFFAVIAENKIQGVAISKFVSISGWIIIAAWFIPEPWQYLASAFPPFLTHKAWWMALEGNQVWWAPFILSLVLQAGLLVILGARFKRII